MRFLTVNATSASIRPVQQYSLNIFHYVHNLNMLLWASPLYSVSTYLSLPVCRKQVI